MLEMMKARLQAFGTCDGDARMRQSRKILERTWDRDPATRNVYVKWVEEGLPSITDDDVMLRAKFNAKSYHNITGDEIAYLLQFKMEDMQTNPDIKIGSYVYIQNEFYDYEWWLIVHFDDRPQFKQFSIIKCNWTYKWISNWEGKRKVHECLGAARKQNSYNSGVWLDYVFQTAENQTIYFVPTNADTITIMYDTRFLFSDPRRLYPLAWKVSKIESAIPPGLTRFTMTQEMYDPERDNKELMLADYYTYAIPPQMPEPDDNEDVVVITYSGAPAIKAGGSYKTFSAQYSADDDLGDVQWDVLVNDEIREYFDVIINDEKLKIRCTRYDLVGTIFQIQATVGDFSSSIEIEVITL